MKKFFFSFTTLIISFYAFSQEQSDAGAAISKTEYRAAAPKINDLVHTKLDARFDFQKAYLYGKAWITIKPHFYPTDSLTLDAKGMTIHQVALVSSGKNIPLHYSYDNNLYLKIHLNKTYRNTEQYTIYIDYTSKPNEFQSQGSAAITEAKGLYFINPSGEDKTKPIQIWTQGETESNSVWLPTIDKPNQKCTEEISMTVPSKFVTLSNGVLASQKKNADGTRTDTWKMNLPHSPYLFFMGAGEYAIVKDSYKGKEVSYYVEKPYEAVARKIFGLTPEMIKFYSQVLGVDYVWPKYSQIVGREYVSGAMENTTATLHQESAQQDARQLTDGNAWEDVISHELFHHWFGDLVTAESWSNITVNESFADYSEYLWREYKYGKDAADEHGYTAMQNYLGSPGESAKDLVRFYYKDKEDVFDLVSYQKGGRILHMLRNYVGDSAFFKSLHLYLDQNKFGNGNAHKLRLAFEQVTGKDLNWYFNQWYFGSGHPVLDISYHYNNAARQQTVIIKQSQRSGKLFRLPMAIDVYTGSSKTRYNVWIEHPSDSFNFPANTQPDLVNVDAEKITLAVKRDNKTLAQYIHQYRYAGSYIDRLEAINYATTHISENGSLPFLNEALSDKYFQLRSKAINAFADTAFDETTEQKIFQIAKTDPKKTVRAEAIDLLGTKRDIKYKEFFVSNLHDSSYSVAGSALQALNWIDPQMAVQQARILSKEPAKGKLSTALNTILILSGDPTAGTNILTEFEGLAFGQEKYDEAQLVGAFISNTQNTEQVKRGVDALVKFRDTAPDQYKEELATFINEIMFGNIISKKEAEMNGATNAAVLKEQIDYIKSKIPKK
ncbi:MAG: peptidase [Chitinophagaceae bacterium]|nr:peptidase [Chitinophagaceae bacterium]